MADISFIDQIRQTERKSEQIIEDAHRQAQEIQASAQAAAKTLFDETRQKAGSILDQAHAEAEQEAEKIASNTAKETAKLDQNFRDGASSRYEKAVRAVSERIVSLSVDH